MQCSSILIICTDVETWKSKQLIEGVRGLGVSDEDCGKLEEEGIANGRALTAMLRTGSLKEIISESSVEVLLSKVLLSGIISSLENRLN